MPSASSKSSQLNQPIVVVDLLQEPIKNAVSVADKKLRNLEKRKLKILETKKKADQGIQLNEDQKKALGSLESVDNSLESVKDIKKNLQFLEGEYSKLFKKEQKRIKQEHKDQMESRSLEVVFNIIEIQGMLGELSEEVRPDFLSGENGACQLTEKDLEHLDTIYELINPTASDDKDKKLSVRIKAAGEHIVSIVEGRTKNAFEGVTYKDIRDILQKIKISGYFDRDLVNGGSGEDISVAKEAPEEEQPPEKESLAASPEEEYPPSRFREDEDSPEASIPVVPINGVDLPPEVQGQETPENEKIDFMGESEINTGSADLPPLNPISPEFVPRKYLGNADDNNRQDGDIWQQVEGQNHQSGGNYRGRGGRGGRGFGRGGRGGRGGGGNFRGGPRDGNFRGGNRGGSRGGRGGNREGGYRGGQRDGNRGGRGGRGGAPSSGGFGQPCQ